MEDDLEERTMQIVKAKELIKRTRKVFEIGTFVCVQKMFQNDRLTARRVRRVMH